MEKFLQTTIKEAGTIALNYFRQGVEFKTKAHLGDLVTVADLEVSAFLQKQILAKYPDHGFHSEELKEPFNPDSEYLWMVDPVDGTRNFAKGIPMWCVMVALWHNNKLEMSAVYSPVSNELFFAKSGKGATLNNKLIHVNQVESLEQSFGCAIRGTSSYITHAQEFCRLVDRLTNDTTAWTHNFGTMLASCYVASGGVDFFAENGGLDHDYAAPTLICSEAGALVTDSEGNPWQRGRRDIVIANPNMHKKVLELLK